MLLDEERYDRLEQHAKATDRSVGAVIREAIDHTFPARTMTAAEALDYFRTAPRLEGEGRPEDIKRDVLSTGERLER